MSKSILSSTKKALGIADEDTSFDMDIIMHINSAFATLTQLAVGPIQGFQIEDKSTEWVSYLDDDLTLNNVKTYIYFRVRLAFDPPTTSFGITAIKEQVKELEWRINVTAENFLTTQE